MRSLIVIFQLVILSLPIIGQQTVTYNVASATKNGEDLGISPLKSSVTWDNNQFYDIVIRSQTKSGDSYQVTETKLHTVKFVNTKYVSGLAYDYYATQSENERIYLVGYLQSDRKILSYTWGDGVKEDQYTIILSQ